MKSHEDTNVANGKNMEKSMKSTLSSSSSTALTTNPLTIDSAQRVQIQQYLHSVSGQLMVPTIQQLEHDYAKNPHIHPDPLIRAQPTKYLFMKDFPRHLFRQSNNNNNNKQNNDDSIDVNDDIDVVTFDEEKKIPFLTPKPTPLPLKIDEDIVDIDQSITDQWTNEQNKLWTRAIKIINSDRLARLSFEGHVNEILLKRSLQYQTAHKFRELFASTFWCSTLLIWLHETLLEFLNTNYQSIYIESLQILRQKIPSLIEKFYPIKDRIENKNRPTFIDPLFNTLSHYKPKKLPRKPIFLFIPHEPNLNLNNTTSPRLKYWSSLLSSMGKLVPLSVTAKSNDYLVDILNDIRYVVNEKIKNLKNSYTSRPIILIGFDAASIIAIHCALQNYSSIAAIVCLGFPLRTLNGIRGELGDTILELTCPIQFIIGENSTLTSIDEMEDFRERMLFAQTNLVVIGGANDKLIVSNTKKRLNCLTQSMIDRCIVDEIYEFLSPILINYNEDSNNYLTNNYHHQTQSMHKDGKNSNHHIYYDEYGQPISIAPSSSNIKMNNVGRKRQLYTSKKRLKMMENNDITAMYPDEINRQLMTPGMIPQTQPTKRKRRTKKEILMDNYNMNNNKTPGTITTTTSNNNGLNSAQILGRANTITGASNNAPSFTILPFQTSTATSHLATFISSTPPSSSTTTSSTIDRQQFNNIKIERSQIISIDNLPLSSLTTKKIVKKTSTISPTAIHLADFETLPSSSSSFATNTANKTNSIGGSGCNP